MKGVPLGNADPVGISARSSQFVSISRNMITGNFADKSQVGLLAWSPEQDKGGPLENVTFQENTVKDVGGDGIRIHSGQHVFLLRNAVSHSGLHDLVITKLAYEVVQQDNVLE